MHALGKIEDIFSGRGIATAVHTVSNRDGIEKTISAIRDRHDDFVFTNLVDFDTKYGHRNDVVGYAKCLEELDSFMPWMVAALRPGDLLMLSADHGGDPCDTSTDHTREYVPMVAAGPGVTGGADIGTRKTFADLGATVAEHLGIPPLAGHELPRRGPSGGLTSRPTRARAATWSRNVSSYTATSSHMTIAHDTRLGPYEILAPIGAGGMGEVYRAQGRACRQSGGLEGTAGRILRK